MDRAEAIKELTQWRDQMKSHGVPNYGKKLTALDLAIEALLADTVHKPDYSYEAGMVRRLKEWQELDKAIQGDAESATTTDCISRQQAIEALTGWQTEPLDEDIVRTLESLPPVTPTERTGEWIDRGWKGDWQFETDGRGHCWKVFECSVCNGKNTIKTRFCPHCGAKMGGDAE